MASVLDYVKHYQHAIEKYSSDEQKVLKCIDKLYNLGVTVQHLQETGVGRTINALRKEPGDVGTAAKALVNKWKLMVTAEENSEPEDHNHDTTNYNGHGHGRDSDDNVNQSRDGGDKRDHKSSQSSKHNDHRHMNGDHNGSKRKYHSSEDSEPDLKKTKRNQYSNKDDDRKPDTKIKSEVKSESSDSESDDSDSQSDESDMSDSEEERKEKPKIKTEPTDKHKSSSSKNTQSNHEEHNRDSSSKRSHESSDNHSKHSSNDSGHSNEKSSKEKSSTSSKSSKDKHEGSDKKHNTEHKSRDKEKASKSDSSSDKHKSRPEKSSSSSSDRHKTHSENKHTTKTDKQRSSSQSHKTDKDNLKSPSEKEKSKSKVDSSNSSNSKHSSSSDKERSKSCSSKEKSSRSHSKSEKKRSSSSDRKSKSKDKSGDSSSNEKESKPKSSSDQSKSSSSKAKDDQVVPKIKKPSGEDSDEGIDCISGASFAEALGMISPAKAKKKVSLNKEISSPSNAFNSNDYSPAALLAPTAKLAPLPPLEISALPEISPHYRPRPPPKLQPHAAAATFTDEELSASIYTKNQRTKVYSGNKTHTTLPTLYECCVSVLQEHIDALEYTGGVPYDILKPVVDRATPQQLYMLEHFNPYLMEDTDHLWRGFCERHFRAKKRQELETWREMYMRCQEEQEHKLKSLTANIKMTQEAKKAPIKQTKMAYVDSAVKPPRNIARKQAVHGTASLAAASPAARVASLAASSHVRGPGAPRAAAAAPIAAHQRPRKAPLMQKALQFMRGRKR